MHLADFFVRNDCKNRDRLKTVVDRYIDLILGVGLHTPDQNESAMAEASAASSKSACMSRQVGSVIYSLKGELIGVGDNDVPKAAGGLYNERDGANDHRCFKWGNKICHNDAHNAELYSNIYKELKASNIFKDTATPQEVEEAVKKTGVSSLIEYSRAVHAEMEAIVAVARGAKDGIIGGTLYTTTFRCHSCARHIVASGISTVIYVEPYSKSLALELHSDAISTDATDRKKVQFLQFEGVAPKNVLRLFKAGERKETVASNSLSVARQAPSTPSRSTDSRRAKALS